VATLLFSVENILDHHDSCEISLSGLSKVKAKKFVDALIVKMQHGELSARGDD
jgi:hypothetical protein